MGWPGQAVTHTVVANFVEDAADGRKIHVTVFPDLAPLRIVEAVGAAGGGGPVLQMDIVQLCAEVAQGGDGVIAPELRVRDVDAELGRVQVLHVQLPVID